jgi:hypothetical protein
MLMELVRPHPDTGSALAAFYYTSTRTTQVIDGIMQGKKVTAQRKQQMSNKFQGIQYFSSLQ